MNFDEFLQPAIFGLTGKPGAGKSYFATRLIIAEITKGMNRPIVTNVPINEKKLREYVQKDFYYYPLETYTDNKTFFTNRGYYKIEIDNHDANIDFKPLLKEDDEGVLYIVDEAHLYFNARNWKQMPQCTISYAKTIRHVGDSLIWMSQKYSDIDAQLRGTTQAFHLLRNLEKEKLGFFKRGTGFRCYQYQNERDIESHGSSTSNAAQDFSYPFELQIAECYNTSLFNKSHDKKYRIKAIPLNYIVYAAITLFVCMIYWVSTGGLTDLLKSWVPATASIQKSEVVTVQTDAQLAPADPLRNQVDIVMPEIIEREIPVYAFRSETGDVSRPYREYTEDNYQRDMDYWFGERRKCKLTFISDKDTRTNTKEFSFALLWNSFAEINSVDLSSESGIWQMRSNYFSAFVQYVKDSGKGANLKEVDLVLKENVPYSMTHGFQLPQTSSVATQGVIRTQNSYMDVGFQLDLTLECIDDNEMLIVMVDNTDVMDITSDNPILQTFRSNNVIDVTPNMTYQIADFRSVTSQVSKGIFKNNDYSTEVTNKIFITYGDL